MTRAEPTLAWILPPAAPAQERARPVTAGDAGAWRGWGVGFSVAVHVGLVVLVGTLTLAERLDTPPPSFEIMIAPAADRAAASPGMASDEPMGQPAAAPPTPEVRPVESASLSPPPLPAAAQPVPEPEAKPTPAPEAEPTPAPEAEPTSEPAAKPTSEAAAQPAPEPAVQPTTPQEAPPPPRQAPAEAAKPAEPPPPKPKPKPEPPRPRAQPTPPPQVASKPAPPVEPPSQPGDPAPKARESSVFKSTIPGVTASGRNAQVRPLVAPPPAYPQIARDLGEEGTVVLAMEIDAEGRVTGASVLESSDFGSLDQAAIRAARAWRFEAAMQDGRAVASTVHLPFRFKFRKN